MNPFIIKREVELSYPSENDTRANDQRLKDALGINPLEIPLSLFRNILAQIKAHHNNISCIIGETDLTYRIIDVSKQESYSIALDLGTTNLVASLHDNVNQRDILEMKVENPQVSFGSDILTRMHHVMSGRSEEAYQALFQGINMLIERLCQDAEVKRKDIHAMVVAGNTVMSHFFLNLDISTIPVAPFMPLVRNPGFFRASEFSLDIHPEALVYVFPNAGSYVGGDIIAGIVASGMYASDEPSVLIDVGTNAEIVIGNKDWLLVGAGAAGPALEEGISLIGKRAEKGIIYDVVIKNGQIECKTFDNARPEGICGSGMVSLIYEMYREHIIGNDGILNHQHKEVKELIGEKVFRIPCDSDKSLLIKQREIENFLRSKAAMFTLLLVLLRSVGLHFRDIHKVYVAGALGNGINVEKAVGIGMFPEWSQEIIVPLGNTSLHGARKVLADRNLVDVVRSISDRVTYKHMHDDPEFMKEFMGAVFIPHTNPELLRVP